MNCTLTKPHRSSSNIHYLMFWTLFIDLSLQFSEWESYFLGLANIWEHCIFLKMPIFIFFQYIFWSWVIADVNPCVCTQTVPHQVNTKQSWNEIRKAQLCLVHKFLLKQQKGLLPLLDLDSPDSIIHLPSVTSDFVAAEDIQIFSIYFVNAVHRLIVVFWTFWVQLLLVQNVLFFCFKCKYFSWLEIR